MSCNDISWWSEEVDGLHGQSIHKLGIFLLYYTGTVPLKDPTTIVKITTAISKNVLFRSKHWFLITSHTPMGKNLKLTLHEKILNVNRSQPFGGTGQRRDIKGELMGNWLIKPHGSSQVTVINLSMVKSIRQKQNARENCWLHQGHKNIDIDVQILLFSLHWHHNAIQFWYNDIKNILISHNDT